MQFPDGALAIVYRDDDADERKPIVHQVVSFLDKVFWEFTSRRLLFSSA